MSIQEAKDYALQQFVQLEKDKALEAERSRMLEGLLLQNRYSNSDETNLVQYLDVVRLINSGVEYSANKDESGLVTCGYKGHMYSHCDCDVPTPLTPVGNDSPFGRGKSQKNRRIQRLRSENHNLRTQIEKLQKKDFASDIETCSGCKKEYAVGPYPHRCKSLKTEQGLKIEQGIVLSDFMKEEIKYLLTKCYYRNAKEEICESQGHVSGHVSKSSIWAERVDRVLEHLGIVEPLVEPTEFGTKVTATLSDNGHKWTAELVRVGGPMLSGRAWLEDGAGSWHWADLINPKLVEK